MYIPITVLATKVTLDFVKYCAAGKLNLWLVSPQGVLRYDLNNHPVNNVPVS